MEWKKGGRIYEPDKLADWKQQFAMTPVPLRMKDRIRVFVGLCDDKNVGRIGYVDVDLDDPSEVLAVSDKPVLDIGRDGAFDDNGVVPISLIEEDGKILLYYIGFQLGVKTPYYMFGGLAISEDGGETFTRYSESPVLDRVEDEIFARCGIYAMKDIDGLYKMWYIGSNKEGWTMSQGKLKPLYIMKYTYSEDGIHWNHEAVECLQYKNEDEHGFGRPYVWREGDKFKMLYSIRTYSRGYYIGYAESEDGIHWERMDDLAGITNGASGEWDDTNLSYPYLFQHGDRTYMFYNGNGCGKNGFGYAEKV